MIRFLMLCSSALLPLYADAVDNQQFAQACTLQQKKQYEQAVAVYDQMDTCNPSVLLNKGSCYFCLKNYSQAVACWRRAQKSASIHQYDQLQTQIDVAYKKLHTEDSRTGLARFADRVLCYTRSIPLVVWQLILIALWYLLWSVYYWYAGHYKGVILSVLILFNIFFGTLVGMRWSMHARKEAVVITKTSLFVGPDSQYRAQTSLVPGKIVSVLDQRGEWCKVKQNGILGWLQSSMIEQL